MVIKCFLLEPVPDESHPLEHDETTDWPSFFAYTGFRNPLTGETREHPHEFGPGAMWWAAWLPKGWTWDNEVEPHLCVETPGGTWNIDSRASNCTQPTDRVHRCWVRHGVPPVITVDKSGLTCGAGGGSILCGGWHGFLRAGELVT